MIRRTLRRLGGHGHGHGHHHEVKEWHPDPRDAEFHMKNRLRQLQEDGPGGYTKDNSFLCSLFLSIVSGYLTYKYYFDWTAPPRPIEFHVEVPRTRTAHKHVADGGRPGDHHHDDHHHVSHHH